MIYISAAKLIERRLNGRKPPAWKTAVLSFRDRKGSDGLVHAFNAEPLEHTVFYGQEAFAESPFVFEANLGPERIGIITRCIWGGPQAAIMVEELAHVGVQYVIGYGSAGALDPSLQLGQQVVASLTLAADGTSSAYNPTKIIEADANLLKMTLRSATCVGSVLTPVVAVTVDTFYRETEDLVAKWRGQGAQIVTFDASPLYAVSKACGMKSMWLSHVSDRLGGQWDDWFWDRDAATRQSEKICVELCRQIMTEASKRGESN